MTNLAQFDLGEKSQEARIQALLEDLVNSYMGGPENRLALAVWWRKSLGIKEQHLLLLFNGAPYQGILQGPQVPLYWKMGSSGSPLVFIETAEAAYFSTLLKATPQMLAHYKEDFKVLHFNKYLLPADILDNFQVITDPAGLMKGWSITEEEYKHSTNIQDLLSRYGQAKPNIGLVKTEEKDFEQCRGVLHVERSQKWLPLTPEGIQSYTYYRDQQAGRPVYFLFEGGALYEVLRFEVKTAPEYADRLLGKTPDDRYPEVYLRAVRPPAKPAA